MGLRHVKDRKTSSAASSASANQTHRTRRTIWTMGFDFFIGFRRGPTTTIRPLSDCDDPTMSPYTSTDLAGVRHLSHQSSFPAISCFKPLHGTEAEASDAPGLGRFPSLRRRPRSKPVLGGRGTFAETDSVSSCGHAGTLVPLTFSLAAFLVTAVWSKQFLERSKVGNGVAIVLFIRLFGGISG